MPSAPRLPAVDGLRGLALLLVLLFHANLLGIGWVGVQLFFVLSGFLITRQLLELREASGFATALRHFWQRRAIRILPALGAFLLLLGALGQLLDAAVLQADGRYWLAAAAFYYNIELALDPAAKSAALGHLWSLSIEEQFYLIWPLLVLGLPRRALPPLLLALICAAPLLRWWLGRELETAWAHPAPAIAVLTPAQMDAFAWGAALCWLPERIRAASLARWLPLALLPALALGIWINGPGLVAATPLGLPLVLGYPNALPQAGQYIWGYSLLNLLGAWWIASALQRRPPAWLAWPALAALGRISYAGYLWHFPLSRLLSPLLVSLHQWTGWPLLPCLLLWLLPLTAATVLLAQLSMWLIEAPLRRRLYPARPPGML